MSWSYSTYKLTYVRAFGKWHQNLLCRISHWHSRWVPEAFLEILNAIENHWEMAVDFSKIPNNLGIRLVIPWNGILWKIPSMWIYHSKSEMIVENLWKVSLFSCPGRRQLAYFIFFFCISTSICSQILEQKNSLVPNQFKNSFLTYEITCLKACASWIC